MLLGLEGSHGLDLSFVTHIFFLDEILDKSVESQVVARAYRMGASQAVKVEQLVASNSIEELIVERNKRDGTHDALYSNSESCETKGEFIQSSFGQNNISAQEKKDQHAKRNFLLSNLTLIKCHHQKSISKTKKGKLERRVKFDL
jgi:SNF2 family DNA or RNA helicase